MANKFLALALPGVQELQPYLPGKPIEALERELGISEAIKLASNENPLGPGPVAIAAAEQALQDVSRYPDGNGFALKAALAEKYQLDSEQITLGNGSNEVLELLTRAFVSPENEIIFSEHAFAVYPIVTQAVGAKAVVAPAKAWGHDIEAMLAAITPATRLIFIANPNNPTGTWINSDTLYSFLEQVPDHVLVVIDEAYYEYVDEDGYPDTISWLNRFDNLVISRTFSKAYGMAGLRVGFAIANPEITDILNRVRQPFNVNTIALAAALAALQDAEHLNKSILLNRRGMQQLVAGFEKMQLDYIPSVANFVAVDVQRNGTEVYQSLLHHGVIVRPVENYNMPNHLRVTVGLEQENKKFIQALATVLGREIK